MPPLLHKLLGSLRSGLSLQRKLLLTILGASALSSLVAACALFVFQTFTLREEFAEHTVALARIVAPYSAAPIAFGDKAGIDRSISILASKPELVAAGIISGEGAILGSVGPIPQGREALPPPGAFAIDGWLVHAAEPINAKDETLGILYFVADFRPVFKDSIWRFLPTLGVVLLITLAFGTVGTLFISNLLTHRLARLAETTRRITQGSDYTLRAPEGPEDEIGILTRSFNKMLAQLESNDSMMRSANASLTAEIQERERLQAELIESSRMAGMAEIATGVLHNVGNVLNSVNVSASLIRDHLNASQLDKLRLSAALIDANRHDLARFFTADERGRLLPDFLCELATQLESEHRTFAEELLRLTRNIEHIKGIVVLQQNFAKSTTVTEEMTANELFEHALLINQAMIAKHHVQLFRDFPAMPVLLRIDRHKMLQILINLISNAVIATLTNPESGRHLRVALASTPDQKVIFLVTDNGAGIEPEIMPKLFTQGFTTRADGHGFGLHSAALAAKAIGGSIKAHSDGPGKGACFTVIAPLTPATPQS